MSEGDSVLCWQSLVNPCRFYVITSTKLMCKGDSKWNFSFWAAGPEDVEGQYFCHSNVRMMKILCTREWFDEATVLFISQQS